MTFVSKSVYSVLIGVICCVMLISCAKRQNTHIDLPEFNSNIPAVTYYRNWIDALIELDYANQDIIKLQLDCKLSSDEL